MKNLLFVFAMVFVTFTSFAQSVTVELFFAPSVHVLNQKQADSLIAMLDKGYYPTSIIGYANTLPNLNGMPNNQLATLRAEEVAGYVDLIPSNIFIEGTTAATRKVVVVFELDENFTNETFDSSNTFETVEDYDNYIVDSMMKAANNRNNTDIDSDINDSKFELSEDNFSTRELSSSTIETLKPSTITLDEFTAEVPMFTCRCEDADPIALWSRYKELQDSAQFYVHSPTGDRYADNEKSKVFRNQATSYRICFEKARAEVKRNHRAPSKKSKKKRKGSRRIPKEKRFVESTFYKVITKINPFFFCKRKK